MAGVSGMPLDIGLQRVAGYVGERSLLVEREFPKGFVLMLFNRGEKRDWRDELPGR
jgi:hypothetical protein